MKTSCRRKSKGSIEQESGAIEHVFFFRCQTQATINLEEKHALGELYLYSSSIWLFDRLRAMKVCIYAWLVSKAKSIPVSRLIHHRQLLCYPLKTAENIDVVVLSST